jgi:hypothetical protein
MIGTWISAIVVIFSGLLLLCSFQMDKRTTEERVAILEVKVAILLQERGK